MLTNHTHHTCARTSRHAISTDTLHRGGETPLLTRLDVDCPPYHCSRACAMHAHAHTHEQEQFNELPTSFHGPFTGRQQERKHSTHPEEVSWRSKRAEYSVPN